MIGVRSLSESPISIAQAITTCCDLFLKVLCYPLDLILLGDFGFCS